MSIDRSVGFYSIKVISLFIVSILYFITGSIFSLLLDEAVPDNDPVQQSTVMLLTEVSIIFGVIGVVFYMNRMLIKKMPFFLDGYFGFQYSLLHDAASGMIVGYILYAYQDKLISKLKELRVRYTDIYDRVGRSIRNAYQSVF
jgi:hypothetical protein